MPLFILRPEDALLRKEHFIGTIEIRKDKYGQNYRAICKCRIKTNWHTSKDIAVHCLNDEHVYKKKKMPGGFLSISESTRYRFKNDNKKISNKKRC